MTREGRHAAFDNTMVDKSAFEDIFSASNRNQASRRICCAASTMFTSAGLTSSHVRVFSPQSGLIQICWSDKRRRASASRLTISPAVGTRGEWIS
jgi:hypothetical protein